MNLYHVYGPICLYTRIGSSYPQLRATRSSCTRRSADDSRQTTTDASTSQPASSCTATPGPTIWCCPTRRTTAASFVLSAHAAIKKPRADTTTNAASPPWSATYAAIPQFRLHYAICPGPSNAEWSYTPAIPRADASDAAPSRNHGGRPRLPDTERSERRPTTATAKPSATRTAESATSG